MSQLKLTKEQNDILSSTSYNIIISACPGAGKTTLLGLKIYNLLESGESPDSICAITFTNFAAREMVKKIGKRIGFCGTVHSLACNTLSKNKIDFSAALNKEDFDAICDMSICANIEPPTFKYLFVDEFQDVSPNMNAFIKYGIKAQYRFYVGDIDQHIFSQPTEIYGSAFEDIMKDCSFEKKFLTENFRCGKNIIDYAKQFIKSSRTQSSKTILSGFVDSLPYSDLLLVNKLQETDSFKDWMILCRTNEQLAALQDMLKNYGIPTITFLQSDITDINIRDIMNRNVVKILTIHSAKGLEAENVVVIGTVPGFSEQEDRLCYVAATRAKKNLYWLYEDENSKAGCCLKNYFLHNLSNYTERDRTVFEKMANALLSKKYKTITDDE